MTVPPPPIPDSTFHQSVRTRLALLLFTHEPSFAQLKAALSITDGNLDAHLKKLSAAGYLHSRMVLQGRPHTVYQLSQSGAEAFGAYIETLKSICEAAQQEG
ncbi:MAG: transcriptional regulator [Rhodobacteraceae bacterium]|nr:transcriptional regulator [Paracoccaceae bacterium]